MRRVAMEIRAAGHKHAQVVGETCIPRDGRRVVIGMKGLERIETCVSE